MRIPFCEVPVGGTVTPVSPPHDLWMKTEMVLLIAGGNGNAVKMCLSYRESGHGEFRHFQDSDLVHYTEPKY